MNYFYELADLLLNVDAGPIDEMIVHLNNARKWSNKVFVVGNGGSASTASHFVCDLVKNTGRSEVDEVPGIRAFGLSDNVALVTAYSNDEGYDYSFASQLEIYGYFDGVLIAISTSGNSPNVIKAIHYAEEQDMITIGLTGFDGGKLGELVDLHINVPSDDIEKVEDCHLAICHAVTRALREGQ